MILPIRCGNSNRADLQQIHASLLQQRGDAITTAPGSTIWIESQAHARAIFHVWAYNQKMAYQFDPNKMTDFIPRWASILAVSLLPTDTIQQQQQRLAARFAIVNKFPQTQSVTDLMAANLGSTFLGLINAPVTNAYVQFPGGAAITGGAQNVGNGAWYSNVHEIFVETYQPAFMPSNQFYGIVNQVYNILNNYLPSYNTFDWFWNSFSDDGYAGGVGDRATISVAVGSTSLIGSGTSWLTKIDTADSTYNVVVGSILECFDDNGEWQRLTVATVNSNTSITLAHASTSNITGEIYVIQGFFLDSDPTQFPYPPFNVLNLDNVGMNSI